MSNDPLPRVGPQRKRIVRFVAAAFGVLIAGSSAALIWWMHDTSDLDAVRARARAQGVAVDWSEFALIRSPSLDIRKRLGVLGLGKGLASFAEAYPRIEFQPFQPIPPQVAEHYSRQDQAALQALALSVDALPDGVVTMDASCSFDSPALFAFMERRIASILRDRLLLAPTTSAGREARRLVHFVTSADPLPVAGGWRSYEMGTSTVAAVAGRLTDLKADGAPLADDLERFARQTIANQRLVARATFVMALQAAPSGLRRVQHGTLFTFSRWPHALAPILERAGRATALDHWLQGISLLDAVDAAPDGAWRWISTSNQRYGENLASSSPAADIEAGMELATRFDAAWPEEVALHARLLAAELRGSPWPSDSLSPGAEPLHRLERNGALVGAYSLNPRSDKSLQDLQGKSPNRYFALYGLRKEQPKPVP